MKFMKNGIRIALLLVLLMIGVVNAPKQEVLAATPIKICAVSYTDDSILVINDSNTKIYYATDIDAARGKWDVIEASGEITAIDISWLKKGTENILKIKGDIDTEARIILLEEPDKLEVSINYSDLNSLGSNATIGQLLNIRASVGNGNAPITMNDLEWKKGEGGHWLKTDYLTKGLLENYMTKGIYLYFRIAPVDDVASGVIGVNNLATVLKGSAAFFAYTKPDFVYRDDTNKTYNVYSATDVVGATITTFPDGTKGRRASDAVKLKISELKASPTTDIDGSKFKAELKYGQEYRVTINSTTSAWTQVTDRGARSLKLSDMLGDAAYGSDSKPFPKMTIEVRNFATSKAASSKITKIVLDKDQRVMQESNAKITYNGVKNVIMTIPDASTSKPYEYCVVMDPKEFNIETARWTKVTKNTGVNILASKAPDNSLIIVRMTEIKYNAKTNSSLELASTVWGYKVTYPAVPTAESKVYTFTKGYSGDLVIYVTLNESGKIPFETGLKYIKLGTKEIPVKEVKITDPITDPTDTAKHVMTITIEKATLESMINCTNKLLYIYYNNGTVDKTSSKLTIKNPSKAPALTISFKAGSTSGTAFQIAAPKLNAANKWYYTTTSAEIKDVNNEDTLTQVITKASAPAPTELTADNLDNYAVTAGYWVSVFEVDASGYIVRYISKQIN